VLWKSFQDKIRQRAYELYIQRGKVDGHALEDWLRSEAELTGRVPRGRGGQRDAGKRPASRRK
jgi:hypothetical protein